jgi:hypothetical protein
MQGPRIGQESEHPAIGFAAQVGAAARSTRKKSPYSPPQHNGI